MDFSKRGSIFTDDQVAAAMIDRLAHHGQMIVFARESYRLKNAHMRQKGDRYAVTGDADEMIKRNAQRRAEYLKRHLHSTDGLCERLNIILEVSTKRKLEWLAFYHA